ncbi:hypothetical protein CR513_07044, partial [Mucuna pruriens]
MGATEAREVRSAKVTNKQSAPIQLGLEVASTREHLFVDGIMEAPCRRARGYDDTSNLDEHLVEYMTQVNLFSSEDVILCRIFLTSLKGLALYWYTQLPAHSIDSFVTLKKKFNTQHSTSRLYHLTPIALVNLRQEEDKPLRSFMARFSNVSMKIHNLNPKVAPHSMIMVQKIGPFFDSLCRDPPTTMDELRTRATDYIQIEEMGQQDKKYCYYHRNYNHKIEGCLTLRDKIEQLIQAGHLCKFVKREVNLEYLAQKQDIVDQRGEHSPRRERTPRREQTPQHAQTPRRGQMPLREGTLRLKGVINTIARGICRRVFKLGPKVIPTHCQQHPHRHRPSPSTITPITFTDQNFIKSNIEQNNPMLIIIEVDNFIVKKVLINQGSSADILYMSTFRHMQILEVEMRPYHEQLVGFLGERVDTHGYINLLATFGDPCALRMISICYLIVEADTSYNVLISRPTLNTLGTIVSTLHLVMKFHTIGQK